MILKNRSIAFPSLRFFAFKEIWNSKEIEWDAKPFLKGLYIDAKTLTLIGTHWYWVKCYLLLVWNERYGTSEVKYACEKLSEKLNTETLTWPRISCKFAYSINLSVICGKYCIKQFRGQEDSSSHLTCSDLRSHCTYTLSTSRDSFLKWQIISVLKYPKE